MIQKQAYVTCTRYEKLSSHRIMNSLRDNLVHTSEPSNPVIKKNIFVCIRVNIK